jgi:hypothetical protein
MEETLQTNAWFTCGWLVAGAFNYVSPMPNDNLSLPSF